LSQLLMDHSFSDNKFPALTETRKRAPPVGDESPNGLLKLRKEGEVSTWIVFASRVMQDITTS